MTTGKVCRTTDREQLFVQNLPREALWVARVTFFTFHLVFLYKKIRGTDLDSQKITTEEIFASFVVHIVSIICFYHFIFISFSFHLSFFFIENHKNI